MTTMTHERRRNAYAGNCCVCFKNVEAGEGWIYSDTRQRRRLRGGFPKKVKCDRCHRENLTNAWQAKNIDNPQPAPPRSWSITQVEKWPLEVTAERVQIPGEYVEGSGYKYVDGIIVHVHVTVNGERVQLAGPDPVLGRQAGPWYMLEWNGIGGHSFSKAAWQRLNDRVYEAVEENSR